MLFKRFNEIFIKSNFIRNFYFFDQLMPNSVYFSGSTKVIFQNYRTILEKISQIFIWNLFIYVTRKCKSKSP